MNFKGRAKLKNSKYQTLINVASARFFISNSIVYFSMILLNGFVNLRLPVLDSYFAFLSFFAGCLFSDIAINDLNTSLYQTLSWRRSLSYRNQPIDLLCKSMYWFLYDREMGHERAKWLVTKVNSIHGFPRFGWYFTRCSTMAD